MLTLPAVLPFLLDHGLLQPAELLTGRVLVYDRARRNQNFEVDCGVRGFFLKQGSDRDGFSGVRREAAVYDLIDLASSRPATPRRILYDPEGDVLVLSLERGARDLRTVESKRRRSSVSIARALGRVLADLHRSVPPALVAQQLGIGSPEVLAAHRPGLALLRDFSASSIELVRLLQREVGLTEHLEELRLGWAPTHLTHHDLRLENVLLGATGRRPLVIDLETAALGDPAWDLGSLVGDYLGLWLTSIPSGPGHLPETTFQLAVRTLDSVQPSIAALLGSYLEAVGDRADRSAPDLTGLALRVTRYAAVKLIQLALEQVQSQPAYTTTALAHLQVATNMLARPADGLTVLLGVEKVAA